MRGDKTEHIALSNSMDYVQQSEIGTQADARLPRFLAEAGILVVGQGIKKSSHALLKTDAMPQDVGRGFLSIPDKRLPIRS